MIAFKNYIFERANKVNEKVNDIYSIHSHDDKETTEEVPPPLAAGPLLWFAL